MPLNNNLCYKEKCGFKEPKTIYVFFCEGATERTLIKKINKDLNGDTSEIWSVAWIPGITERPNQIWFTPKRILDYYLDTIDKFTGNWDYHYNTTPNFRPKTSPKLDKIRKNIKENGAKVCLLIDTDVFFKGLQNINYTNLDQEHNNTLKGHNQQQQHFCDEFRNANSYEFLEQELTFEDFVALFFVGEDTYDASDDRWIFDRKYEMWFRNRFGLSVHGRGTTNAAQRQYDASPKTALANQHTNGHVLKLALAQLLTGQTYEQVPNDKELAIIISNWIVNQNINLEKRIKMAENRMKEHRNWPQHFELIRFLKEHIRTQEDRNER